MRSQIFGVTFCLVAMASAQFGGLPSCALPCIIASSSAAGCSMSDFHCLCTTGLQAATSSLESCLSAKCSAADQATTNQGFIGLCQQAGVTLASTQFPAATALQNATAVSSGTTLTTAVSASATGSAQNLTKSGSNTMSGTTSTSSPANIPSSSSSSDGSNGLSSGAKIGLAAGIPCGVMLLVAVAGGAFFMGKHKRKAKESADSAPELAQQHSSPPEYQEMDNKERQEMDSKDQQEMDSRARQELQGSEQRHELPGEM